MEQIKIFSPATIANVSCGFDVLGLALESVGDIMQLQKTPEKGVKITKITGQNLPLEASKNVAGVALISLLEALGNPDFGFEVEIHKKIKPGSGIGSSAASAAGAVWAANELIGSTFTPTQLVTFAMQGEKLASGVAHADNVAPALLGGFTLVRSYDPLDVIALPVPESLYAVVLHPQIEVKTSDSRKILKQTLTMQQAIKQWGNLGGLVAALYKEDYDLLSRSLVDYVVEPIRSILIPHYEELTQLAKQAGALGTGISGSGPSIFALCQGEPKAQRVKDALHTFYAQTAIEFELHLSKIGTQGVRIY